MFPSLSAFLSPDTTIFHLLTFRSTIYRETTYSCSLDLRTHAKKLSTMQFAGKIFVLSSQLIYADA